MTVAVESAQRSATRPGATAVRVLAAISFSHLLNDTIQSLIAGDLSDAQGVVRAQLHAGRADDADAAADRVAAAAAGRALHRSAAAAVLARRSAWASRSSACCCCRSPARFALLLLAAALVGVGSSVFHPESSRDRADGVRRAARPGAVAVPGRRQRRLVARPAAGGVRRRAARAVEHRVVLARWRCSRWWCCCGSAAGTATHRGRSGRGRRAGREPRRRRVCRAGGSRSRRRSWSALIFSKYFYLASLSSYYTFYLIGKFHVVGADAPAPPVRVPRRGGGRHVPRRPDRRPHRPQVRHLGVDPRRASRSRSRCRTRACSGRRC